MVVVDVLMFALGCALVLWVLSSAIVTVVVPRGESSLLSRALFVTSNRFFEAAARRAGNQRRERIRARYAPVTLMMLPAIWALGIILYEMATWAQANLPSDAARPPRPRPTPRRAI